MCFRVHACFDLPVTILPFRSRSYSPSAASALSSSAGAGSAAEVGAVWHVNSDSPFTSHRESVEDIQWSVSHS